MAISDLFFISSDLLNGCLRGYQTEMLNSVTSNINAGINTLCVAPCGSGKTVTAAALIDSYQTAHPDAHVLFIAHRQEIVENAKSSFSHFEVMNDRIHVCMVRGAVKELQDKEPGLIIIDEAHHSPAKTWTSLFEQYPSAVRVGFTATPIRLSGEGFEKIYSDMIQGPQVQWLIDNNYLSPYEYYAPKTIIADKLKVQRTGDYKVSDVEQLIEERKNVIYGDVISTYNELIPNKQAICYCVSVNSAKETADYFCKAGINAVECDGTTPTAERQQIMTDFKAGKISILCNVDLISEGFDVPDCDAVILLRPTASLSLHTQQAMRCMRFKEGKTAVIIDHVGNVGRFGVPTDLQKWSLEGATRKNVSTTKSCPICLKVIPRFATACSCGHAFSSSELAQEHMDRKRELISLAHERIEKYYSSHPEKNVPNDFNEVFKKRATALVVAFPFMKGRLTRNYLKACKERAERVGINQYILNHEDSDTEAV